MGWAKLVVGVMLASAIGACAADTNDDGLNAGTFFPETRSVSTPENTQVDARIFFDDRWQLIDVDAGPHQAVVDGGVLHITPMQDFYGTFTITYAVTDGVRDPVPGVLTVAVSQFNGNETPIADDADLTFHGSQMIVLPAHDMAGTLPDRFFYDVTSQPTHGALTGYGRTLTYTPTRGFVGDDAFTFTATSNSFGGISKPATVHLHVTEGSAPDASNASLTVYEDQGGGVDLSTSVYDRDGDDLTYTITTPPVHGTATAGSTPYYVPNPNFNGTDSFVYTVDDGLHTATATVTITVKPVNDPPSADSFTVDATEDVAQAITLAGHDIDGDLLSYQITQYPAHGALSGTGATLLYTPAANFNGTDSFKYIAVDSSFSGSSTATVTILVAPVPDLPVAPAIAVTATEDQPLAITLPGFDPDGTAVTFAVASQPAHGTLSGTGPSVTYKPDADYNGTDVFTYTVASAGDTSAPGTVSITVNPVDDAPVAQAGQATTAEDTAVAITLTATDIDSAASELTYAIAGNPAHGKVTLSGSTATYTPTPDYNGADSFSFYVYDGHLSSAPASVTVTVTAINDAPTPVDDYAATDPGQAVTIDVLGNDTDPDGDTLVLDSASAAAHGAVEIDGTKLTYTPDAGFTGLDSFTYTVTDPSGVAATATVHLGVDTFPTGAPIERLALGDPFATSTSALAPTVSNDSRFIAFATSQKLVSDDTNLITDVYLYDRGRRELTRIGAGNNNSQRAVVSGNGRYVVYESLASDLVAGDSNGVMDVFRYDRITKQTIRISVATGGGEGSGDSSSARISDDGDTVAFLSTAFELVAGDANGATDVFVRTVSTGVTERISVSTGGGDADLGSTALALSGDGHWVAFASTATNIVAGDTNALADVFVRDRVHATTTRASVSSTGVEANGVSALPAISSDGRFTAFQSKATNLVAGGSTVGQLYVRDSAGPTTTRPVTNTAATWTSLSGDGRYATLTTNSGAVLVDRFAARSQVVSVGSFPTMAGNGRYLVGASGGTTTASLLIVQPNPY